MLKRIYMKCCQQCIILAGIQDESVEDKTQWGLLFWDGVGWKLMVAIFINTGSKHIWYISVSLSGHAQRKHCYALPDKTYET